MAPKKRDYIRHEFVVNPSKHPDVVAFIEHPDNAGQVGNIIVSLLEFHIWAGTIGSLQEMREMVSELKAIADRIEKAGGAKQSSGKRESNKSALDNL